jgi:uncharacterized Fe-S cluster-containing radical SAM superfamily protein
VSTTIDTDRFSSVLRARGIDLRASKVLVSVLEGSKQEQDLSEPLNCEGLGRIRHFRRETSQGWPENPLPILPAASTLGLDEPAQMRAQVFQNAVCNWRCWYCYVDFPLLAGNREHSRMRSAAELVELFLSEPDRPAVIDLSGGQPDLVPEWVPWMLAELRDRGLERSVYLWSDDNLSNDYFFALLSREDRELLDSAPAYGKVGCFKGFDESSFAFNTAAAPDLFGRQFELIGRLIRETSIDLYGYATFTTPDDRDIEKRMAMFVDQLQEVAPLLPLRVVPLEVGAFTPTRPRMGTEHERALTVQTEAVAAWQDELRRRFSPEQLALPICDVQLRD